MPELLVKNAFPKPVQPSDIKKNWQERGYSFYAMTDRPGQEWNTFVHSTDELLTVVSGKLKLELENIEIICEEGDEVFIPQNSVHSVHNINSDATRWVYGYN